MNTTILVVEDDQRINAWMRVYLERAGYSVLSAFDGPEGLQIAQDKQPDIVVLDLMLPTLSGMKLCSKLRRSCDIPIIMLTAIGEQRTRLEGLNCGADDYMTKPFDPEELVARIQAVLRRVNQEVEQIIELEGIALNIRSHSVSVLGNELELSNAQFKILTLFMRNPNKVLSRNRLIESMDAGSDSVFDRAIDNHILRLRKLLDVHKVRPIKTVYGAGYKFEVSSK